MKVEIWYGLPYKKWVILGDNNNLPLPSNPFKNFRLSKDGFLLQVITQENGETEITIKLPFSIQFSI